MTTDIRIDCPRCGQGTNVLASYMQTREENRWRERYEALAKAQRVAAETGGCRYLKDGTRFNAELGYFTLPGGRVVSAAEVQEMAGHLYQTGWKHALQDGGA